MRNPTRGLVAAALALSLGLLASACIHIPDGTVARPGEVIPMTLKNGWNDEGKRAANITRQPVWATATWQVREPGALATRSSLVTQRIPLTNVPRGGEISHPIAWRMPKYTMPACETVRVHSGGGQFNSSDYQGALITVKWSDNTFSKKWVRVVGGVDCPAKMVVLSALSERWTAPLSNGFDPVRRGEFNGPY